MQNQEAYIFDALRTPRGRPDVKGSLNGLRPVELVAPLLKTIARRYELPDGAVEDVILGCVTQTGEQGTNIARMASLYAGLAHSVSGVTLNRFCTSGLDACQFAFMKILTGSQSLVVAGGVESSSRVPMFSDNGAWFRDPDISKATRYVHMGVSADVIATQEGLQREDLDRYALRSQMRASASRDNGAFGKSVLPIQIATDQFLSHDELVRPQTNLEKLSAMAPAFAQFGATGAAVRAQEFYPEMGPIQHVHHIGSSPSLADGACALLIGSEQAAKSHGLCMRARIVAMSSVAVEPFRMLTGNIPATQKVLEQSNLKMHDIDIVEVNESFAAVALSFQRFFEVEEERFNIHGGAIAMGHPLGATGAILLNTALDSLEACGGRYALVSICGGAGVASAVIIERVRH